MKKIKLITVVTEYLIKQSTQQVWLHANVAIRVLGNQTSKQIGNLYSFSSNFYRVKLLQISY